MKFKSRIVLFVSFILILIFAGITHKLVQNEASESSGPAEALTLGAYAGDTAALVWIAADQGFFAAIGLEVTIKEYEAGKLAADALLAGEVDVATAAEFVLVSNSFAADDLRILGTIASSRVTELVARVDHGIQQPSDLKGKRIGVTRGSSAEFFLGGFLLFNGLTLQDVEIVDLTPSAIIEAISSGQIDATMTWDPNVYTIKNQLGEHAISWPGQSGQDFYFILLSSEAWVETHPSAVEKLLKALFQAEDYVNQNSNEARTQIQSRFEYSLEYIQYIWQKQDFLVTFPQALLIALEDQARWMIGNNLVDQASIPNYLDYIYLDGLEAVRPERVTVIR